MKHSIEINQDENGLVYLKIYEVYVKDENGGNRVYQRYMSEERAEEVAEWLRGQEDDEYKTAFSITQLVFL